MFDGSCSVRRFRGPRVTGFGLKVELSGGSEGYELRLGALFGALDDFGLRDGRRDEETVRTST